jgi:hypothetical protein
MSNKFVIKNGYHSRGDSQLTGSLYASATGSFGYVAGDGSGLSNIPASALPSGLLSGSAQISNNISGSFTSTSSSLASRVDTLETTNTYSGSFSGSFEGDGTNLTGITADPAGSNNTVQFNDSGTTSGSSDFTFNKTSGNVNATIFSTSKIEMSGSVQSTIAIETTPSGSVTFNSIGSGSLFSISDTFSGSLMSVNDVSGLPIFEVFSDDRVIAGSFNKNTLNVSGSDIGLGADDNSGTVKMYGVTEGDPGVVGQVYFTSSDAFGGSLNLRVLCISNG